tara:strand:+ start:7196 stop:7852 length:657 start_codon:yes stop_codon:yes gene_type:complete
MGNKKYLLPGLVGGITGVLCCVAPIVLVLLGFGTAFAMMIMHHFHYISIISGVILMLLISLYLIKRQTGTCNLKSIKQQWKTIATALLIMIVTLFAINYLIVLPFATVVYGNLEVEKKPLGNIVEIAELHHMEQMVDIDTTPENQGMKELTIGVKGLYCGSCGPAISFDFISIEGVEHVDNSLSEFIVTYNSDITNKHIIMATIHEPYTGEIVEEKKV